MDNIKNRKYSGKWIVGLGFLIIVAMWLCLLLIANIDQRLELQRAEQETSNLSAILERHIREAFSRIETSLFTLRRQYESGVRKEELHALLTGVVTSTPDLFNLISIIDASGNVALTDKNEFAPTYSGDRSFFFYHKENQSSELLIGKPILGRVTGKWYLPVSIRLQDSNGNFAGVLLASVNPMYFSMIFRDIALGKYSLVYIADFQGIIYSAISNGYDLGLDKVIPRNRLSELLKLPQGNSFISSSNIDGVRRIQAIQLVKNRSMFISVGISHSEWLQPSNERFTYIMVILICSSLIMLVFMYILHKSIKSKNAAEKTLRESENRLHRATRAACIGVWDWDVAHNDLVWDESMYHLYGIHRNDFAGAYEAWLRCVHPEDKLRVDQEIQATLCGEREYASEFRVIWPDGSVHHILAASQLIRNADGVPVRMVGTNLDVTKRKQDEEALQNERTQLISLFNSIDHVIYVADIDTHELLYVNPYLANELSGNCIGTKCYQALQGLNAPCPFCTNKIILKKNPEPHRWEYFNPRLNRHYDIVDRIIRWSDGRDVRFELAVDITERKRTEEALRASEERLRTTLLSIGDAVITTDVYGRVTGMNTVAEKLTGWIIEEAEGRPLIDVFNIINASTRETVQNPVAMVLETGDIVGLANHTALIARDGKESQIADSAAPIRISSGKTIGVVLVFRDVTEEYALLERVNQIQKMESIGQLAGGVAHDFNNMLGGIIGGVELIQNSLESGKDPRPYLSIVLKSAERAAELTNKLLTFARKQQVASSVIDVLLPLREAISLLTSTADKRIIVQSSFPNEGISVVGDSSQLQSAFLNILINATHAMPEGGNIYVTAGIQELDATFCSARRRDIVPGQYVEIEIRDTGCGMPQEMITRIFEPFFTTKEQGKGTGLGLAVVHGTVTQHKGFMTVYSEVGTGTSFHIFLPIVNTGVVAVPELTAAAVHGHGTILLVDDEAVMRATASAILQELGYEVLLAENGAEALACYEREKERIDLVILDMVMPQMNGRDCFMAMKKIRPEVRAILSSGFSREEEIIAMKEAGLKGFVHKPYRIVTLSQVVSEALKGS